MKKKSVPLPAQAKKRGLFGNGTVRKENNTQTNGKTGRARRSGNAYGLDDLLFYDLMDDD